MILLTHKSKKNTLLTGCMLFSFIGQSVNSNEAQSCQDNNIPKSISESRYTLAKDGSVIDQKTKLTWKKCPEGLGGKKCDIGEAKLYTWGEALAHLKQINLNDGSETKWRLPNIRELSSVVELQCSTPAINTNYFPNTPPEHSWSSSPYGFYPHYSWYVDFKEGGYNYSDRTDKKHIRLVRAM